MLKGLFEPFNQFITSSLYIDAYTNEGGLLKKSTSAFPTDEERKSMKTVIKIHVFKKDIGRVKPNAIAINTANISCIDVDKPDECYIIEDLKRDCNFIVKTRQGFHFYFKKEDVLPRQQLKGIADINTGLLFFCPQYFHIDTKEEYNYTLIKNEPLNDMPEYAIQWCKMLISMKNQCIPPHGTIEKKNNNFENTENCEKIVVNPDLVIEKFDIKTIESILIIFHENNLLLAYEDWRNCYYMIKHLNNTEQAFQLFLKYSRKNPLYVNVDENSVRKQFYGNGKYNINFNEEGVLFKCSKLNPEKFKTTLQHLHRSKYEDQQIIINQQYIYPDDGGAEDCFREWIVGYKALCIKSNYGTGKTYAFKKILKKNPHIKSVLFLTYRQSLAHSLQQELADEYGFKCYLDKKVNVCNEDRIILQLDSLKRLSASFNLMTQEDHIKKYDLIILDESEGLLNHLSFEKINQTAIFNTLTRLIKKADKILLLDGDMSDRTYDFISHQVETFKLYKNIFTPTKKHFIFTHNLDKFNKQIDDDIKNGVKIVIVSMTRSDTERLNTEYSTTIEDIYKKYQNNYAVCIHNSIEKNKEILYNVNAEWTKYQVVLYSPTIEAGIDYNIMGHFDKCYGIINPNSTSYRAFNQMLNRVRNFQNNEIVCLMPTFLHYRVNDILYRYDEIKLTKYAGIPITPLVNTLIHNDVEKINTKNFFMCCFIQSLNNKGHTHKYLNDMPKNVMTNKINDKEEQTSKIFSAENIGKNEASSLINLQQNNVELTREEHYQLEKYFMGENWKTDLTEMDLEFIVNRYNKNNVPKLFYKINLPLDNRIKRGELLDDFEWKKCDVLCEILKTIGFEIVNMEIRKTENIEYDLVMEKLNGYVAEKQFKTLFNNSRTLKKENLLRLLNDTLNEYGYVLLKDVKKSKRNEEGKQHNINTLVLEHIEIIQDYIPKRKLFDAEQALKHALKDN